jgi:hypothetical protein
MLVFIVAHSSGYPFKVWHHISTFDAEEANILDMKCRAIICDGPLRGAGDIIYIGYNTI